MFVGWRKVGLLPVLTTEAFMEMMDERKVFIFDDERIARVQDRLEARQSLMSEVLNDNDPKDAFQKAHLAAMAVTWKDSDEAIANA